MNFPLRSLAKAERQNKVKASSFTRKLPVVGVVVAVVANHSFETSSALMERYEPIQTFGDYFGGQVLILHITITITTYS